MKKVILFSALCLFFHYQAFSQVEFGIKAGVMAADVHEVNIQEHILRNMHAKARFSYLGGGFSDISINPRFSLLVELLYANKGYFTEVSDVKSKNYFHYINLPVLLNYEVFENLHFGIGPEVGYLYATTVKYLGFSDKSMYKKYHNSFDIGIDAGMEYKLTDLLKVGLRYNYGLSNILSNEYWRTYGQSNGLDAQPKMQNRVLQFYIGYTFNKKK